MSRTRTSAGELERSAVEALLSAARELGLDAEPPDRADASPDVRFVLPDDRTVDVAVKTAAMPSSSVVRALGERHRKSLVVFVADQIPGAARDELNDAGIGWLDRRGHIRIVGDGLFIDAEVAPRPRRTTARVDTRRAIAGRSGLAAAAALLLRPDAPIGVSEIARVAGLNPSSITRALRTLVDGGLAERRGRGAYRALVPELFWALSDVWPRDAVRARLPGRGLDDLAKLGSAAAGVRGSVAWGAPIVVTADFPTRCYVPDERALRRAGALSSADTGEELDLAVDPVGLVTATRYQRAQLRLALAHPLFCALDLTASSRDREALEQWTPPEEFTRVW